MKQSEIKSRIEQLVGYGPQPTGNSIYLDWLGWRTDLINRLTEQAKVVYGYGNNLYTRDHHESCDGLSGILLDIQPIKRGVTKAEIIRYLRCANCQPDEDLATRIEREGICE
jgi:hypothetical protein